MFIRPLNRRRLLQAGGLTTAAALLTGRGHAQTFDATYAKPSEVDTGRVDNGQVVFPEWRGPADAPSSPPPAPLPPEQRIGFAIVGLGRLSLQELLPAFGECGRAKVAALVSGSPEKLATVAKQYGVPERSCYSYENFDQIADNPDVQVVYVVLPNGMHREYVERAAAAGKHVLCEKPMATSVADAEAMVTACREAGRKLMVAYRIQYQSHNIRAMRMVRDETFGRLTTMTATNVQTVAENGARQWRHDRSLAGGGSLPDIGIYCINTARFLTGLEPRQVYGQIHSPKGDPRYREVEETVNFQLHFDNGFTANCTTSYGARNDKHQRLNFAEATLDMPDAYSYRGQRLLVGEREGEYAQVREIMIPPKNQFAEQMDHMADCVLQDLVPRTPGEEGVQDHRIMAAIYASAESNAPVALETPNKTDAYRRLPSKG